MRIVVSCALVAVAFFVGWQTEKRDRAVMYLGYRRTAGLDKWNVTGQPIARFALETPRESAELFDIQVRDSHGKWKTLAFAAERSFGLVGSAQTLIVVEKDYAVLKKVEYEEVRLRPTIHPGSTYVCDACATCEVHGKLFLVSDGQLKYHEYECLDCRGRMFCDADSNDLRFSGDRAREDFFPMRPRVCESWTNAWNSSK